jgi:hypothetical protein
LQCLEPECWSSWIGTLLNMQVLYLVGSLFLEDVCCNDFSLCLVFQAHMALNDVEAVVSSFTRALQFAPNDGNFSCPFFPLKCIIYGRLYPLYNICMFLPIVELKLL